MNDWIVEAIRRKVDGPPLVKASALPPRDPRRDVPQGPMTYAAPVPQPAQSQPWKPSPPPTQTFDWTAKFNYWAGRDQAGVIERQEFLAEAGVPIDILGRSPDKILTWCKYHLPNGPIKEQHEEEVQSTEEAW